MFEKHRELIDKLCTPLGLTVFLGQCLVVSWSVILNIKAKVSVLLLVVVMLTLGTNILQAQALTNVGTDFWIAFPPNGTGITIKVFISSSVATSGNISSAVPGVDQSFTVVPGLLTEIELPDEVQLFDGLESKGIRIVTVDPVSVYGLNFGGGSTDAFTAFPVASLGTSYRMLDYSVSISSKEAGATVVAVTDGTTVAITNHQSGVVTNKVMNEGQTFLLQAAVLGDDLTGSLVTSNFPVAVFGSVELVNVPSSCNYGDYIVEQMMPITSWGKNFITVATAGRGETGDIFRVLAHENATQVWVNGTLVSTLGAGDFYETSLAGMNSITASKAVLVAQYAKGISCSGSSTGDPFMMLIPPREQFLMQYTIGTVAGFTTYFTNLVAPDYAINSIFEDGVLIPSTAFQAVGTTGFYGAQRPISTGTHVYSGSSPFGVFSYGWTNVNSYGYPGGCSLSPVATVSSISLIPLASSGILDVTSVCLTAHVENTNNEPVANILVDFNFSGLSVFKATAYTDLLGNAEYCYVQNGPSEGVHQVIAGVSALVSNTASVTWSNIPCIDPTDGGAIGNPQSGCAGFDPLPLLTLSLPVGGSGTVEYKWQRSVTGNSTGFFDIPGSDNQDFDPGPAMVTTWLRRLARVDCSPDWLGAAVSNVVELTIMPAPAAVSIRHN